MKKTNSKLFKLGSLSFNLGSLTLASMPLISTIFFICSLIISYRYKFRSLLSEKSNLIFAITSIIMLFNAFVIHNLNPSNLLIGWDAKLSLIGLTNWIPFFLCFSGFQNYLENFKQRNTNAKLLLIGSIPILVTGLGQYFLGWDQKIDLFNGAIIWFMKPIDSLSGLSGLFNNPNYTSAWLSIIWPFCLYFTLKRNSKIFENFRGFIFLISYVLTLLLTNSRSGWFSIIIPFPILFGFGILKIIIFLTILFIFLLLSIHFNLIPLFLEEFLLNLIPEKISNVIFLNFNNYYLYPRLDIWRVSINSIFMKPIFGWGAASFPFIYSNFRDIKIHDTIQHSHNLFLELSINYGIVVALIIFINIIFIMLTSIKVIFSSKEYKDHTAYKAWFIATLVFLFTQTFDVTYYDLRISLLFWILLSGLNAINQEHKNSHSKL